MLSLFPLDVLDEIWDLIELVSEDFPTYSCDTMCLCTLPLCFPVSVLSGMYLSVRSMYVILLLLVFWMR